MKLSPSLLSADFGALRAAARTVEPVTHSFHMDVMDGHFVPNLTFGPPVVNAFRRGIERPLDIHLMVDNPVALATAFQVSEADSFIFHAEATADPSAAIIALRKLGARVGISLRPATPVDEIYPFLSDVDLILVMSVEPGFGGQRFLPASAKRIRRLRSEIGERDVQIAVDGGINAETAGVAVAAGADILVVGSAIFGAEDPVSAAAALLAAAT